MNTALSGERKMTPWRLQCRLATLCACFWAAIAHAAPYGYIGSGDGVVVIDTANDTVVATVPVPVGAYRLALNAAGTRVYISSLGDKVSVLDATTNQVIDTLSMPSVRAVDLAISPDGKRIYVTNDNKPGLVFVIDVESGRLAPPIAVLDHPRGIAVAPDGSRLYVATNATDERNPCVIIDLCAQSLEDIEIATVTHFYTVLGADLRRVVASPDGSHTYVTNLGIIEGVGFGDVVSVLDRGALIGRIPIPGASALAVNPSGTRLYVVGGPGITVVDTASNQILAQVAVPAGAVAINPAGTRAYATTAGNSVVVLDTATNQVMDTIVIGRDAGDIAIGPEVIGTSPSPTPSATPTATSTETSVPTATATPRGGGGGCAIDSGHGRRDYTAPFILMGWALAAALRSRARTGLPKRIRLPSATAE